MNFIAKKAEIKAETKAMLKKHQADPEMADISSFKILDNDAPKIIGIDKRKENLTAASLFNLLVKPAKMVIPDLEVPGIIATACAKPI